MIEAQALHVLVVMGTRPEAIKLCPVIAQLRADPVSFAVRVCATAQHRQMLDSVLDLFGVSPDIDLDLMSPDQSLNQLMGQMITRFDAVLVEERPDWVLVQGDTTTAMTCALAAFHRGIRVGHVEAGLRTGNLKAPFPEEANRRVVALVASLHFAPTQAAADNLRCEGIAESAIRITGNTVIDALQIIAARPWSPPPALAPAVNHTGPLVLATMHRRESFGEPMRAVCRAMVRLVAARPDVLLVLPVHPNPRVAEVVREELSGAPGVLLCDPLDYADFTQLLRRADLVISDSGGVQEEAPTFGKDVLVLRETTERPEGVAAGFAHMVGADEERVLAAAIELLTPGRVQMQRGENPYGDGLASSRIAQALKTAL